MNIESPSWAAMGHSDSCLKLPCFCAVQWVHNTQAIIRKRICSLRAGIGRTSCKYVTYEMCK